MNNLAKEAVAKPAGEILSGESDKMGVAPVMLAGAAIVFLFFGVFGGWAALAPLKSAALAPGTVIVENNRKTIKHLEGGIVGKIFVADGDVVSAGQTLIQLDDTQAQVMKERLRGRLLSGKALEARLLAERDKRDDIEFPETLTGDKSATDEVVDALNGQRSIFQTRRDSLIAQQRIFNRQIAQLHEEITGLRGQISSENTQLSLLSLEMKDVQTLVDKGLAKRSRLLSLQRGKAEIEGSRSRNIAAIARAGQQISETELRLSELETQRLNEVVEELGQVQTEVFDLEERIRSSEDVLQRTDIRAPLDGTIVGLQVHTTGGVIAPGEPLMNLVPSGANMIVEAQIDPGDIDVVHADLPAQVRLTAFNQRNLAPLDGRVITISADRLTDERTGAPYFLAQIALVGDLSKETAIALYPGMQAEVIIVTGERTMLEYIFRPIAQSLSRAFREE